MILATFWAAMRKELLRLWHDPLALTLWAGIPLVIGTLVTLALGGSGGSVPKARVWVVDNDESFLSKLLLQALSAQGSTGVVTAEQVLETEGRAKLAAGDGSALLIIPAGFGAALLAEEATQLDLLTNPAQRILPGIVQEMLEILAEGSFYLQRALGTELRAVTGAFDAEHTPTAADVAEIAVLVHGVVERVEKYVFPPAIELETIILEEAEEANSSRSLSFLFLPGVVVMALFFAAQGMSEHIWRDRNQGLLRRLCSTPYPIVFFLTARCAACALVLLLLSASGLALGMLYHELPLSRLPLAALWSAFAGSMLLALMLVLQLMASSQRAGTILTNTVLFPLLLIGGSFFPLEALPEAMAMVGRHTPNGWASAVMAELLLGQGGLVLCLRSIGIATAVGLPLFWIAARRLRSGFAQGA